MVNLFNERVKRINKGWKYFADTTYSWEEKESHLDSWINLLKEATELATALREQGYTINTKEWEEGISAEIQAQ